MKFCDRKKKLITSSSDLKTKPSLWPHSQLITCSSDCGFCSHWPPSWFGSKARWHWPGWQTVCADARCSAAGRALQSKPGRAAAPAAWPTAAGRLMETPKCVNTESCGYNKDGNNATCNEWRNSFSPPIFFFLKDLLSALHSFHNTSSYSLTEYKNKSLMPLKLTKAWICFDWSCHTHFTLL